MNRSNESRTVKSVAVTTEIIKRVRTLQGATVSELAEQVDLSPASVHSHLATLKRAGFVVQRGHTYDLGPQLLTLGEYVRNHSDLYQASREQVDRLARETGECAHLTIEHDGQLFILYEEFGPDAVGIEYHDWKRQEPLDHLHCTATGKAILSRLPAEEVEAILDYRGMPSHTAETITDREALFDQLADFRERGHAYADGELMSGIRAVGAAIEGSDGEVEGAIAVTGPSSRLRGERFRELLPRRVLNAANVCEVNLQTATIK